MDTLAAPAAPSTMSADIVWGVRMVVRIVLLVVLPLVFLYMRNQPDKSSSALWSQPHEVVRDKEDLLSLQKGILQEHSVPTSLATLKLKAESELPGFKARGGDKDRTKRATAPTSKRRPPEAREEREAKPAFIEPEVQPTFTEAERRSHEALLTFVATSHKQRPRRVFLPEGPPPPPPRADISPLSEAVTTNAEAQRLLKAVLHPKVGMRGATLSRDLRHQLANTEMAEETLSLMAEVCATANDLEGASELLMKMEAQGQCPDNFLLDKVMDLYSARKSSEPKSPTAPPWAARAPPVAHASAVPNFDAFSDED